ncbi:hypothetical protein BD310DRAFT_664125 [Dichomitus squalens]|uniref:Uncharacterized protein n=1 Tax=Dichomitus squalens TaxID=114155 RepID=A0A4V2K9A0_9APHY|nr:hypothetical protein BD310DRAFT_664125 [Dichomitus squalens]
MPEILRRPAAPRRQPRNLSSVQSRRDSLSQEASPSGCVDAQGRARYQDCSRTQQPRPIVCPLVTASFLHTGRPVTAFCISIVGWHSACLPLSISIAVSRARKVGFNLVINSGTREVIPNLHPR